jgi:purine nucleosidase
MSQDKYAVIFDTDPGVDDAMALAFALAHPRIELVGVTTVFGNVYVQQATQNALYLLQLAGSHAPVAQGAAQPLQGSQGEPPAFIHGADGLGNLANRAASDGRRPEARSAAQFIVDSARARPGEITLVPVGPLTNIALALKLEPRLPQLVRQVVLMGGAVREPGNVSPVAEANIWGDPDAADAVFTAGFALTMVGLDVTHRVHVRVSMYEELARLKPHPLHQTLLHAVRFYAEFYATRYKELEFDKGCCGHDVLAFMALLYPQHFEFATGRLRCATQGVARGQTILHDRPERDFSAAGFGSSTPLSMAAMKVDVPAVLLTLRETMFAASWRS